MDCSLPGSSVHGDSPGTNTGMGSLSLLQGIFPTQGLNPGLLHGRQILYHLSHQGSRTHACVHTHTHTRGMLEGGVIARVQGVITFFLLRMVYQFLFAAVMNNHKLHGLKQHNALFSYSPGGRMSEMGVTG